MFDMSEDEYMSCNTNTAMLEPQQTSFYQGDSNGTNISISAIISASCVLVDGTDFNSIPNHHSFTSHVTPQQPLHHQHLTSQQQNNFIHPAWPQSTSGNDCQDTPGTNICQERTDFDFCTDCPDSNLFSDNPKENQKFNVSCSELSSYNCQFENGSKNSDHYGLRYPYKNDHVNRCFDTSPADFSFDSNVDDCPIRNMQSERKEFVTEQYMPQPLTSIWREGQPLNDNVGDTREFERDLNTTSLHQYGGKIDPSMSSLEQIVGKEFTIPQYLNTKHRRQWPRHITPAPTMSSLHSVAEDATASIKAAPSGIDSSLPMVTAMNVESSQIMATPVNIEPSHSQGDKIEMPTLTERDQIQMVAPTNNEQLQMPAPTINMSPPLDDRAWLDESGMAPELNSTMPCKIDIDVDHMLSKGVTVAGYKPRPIIRKKRKKAVVQEQKNVDYWNRRTKNNDSARKSREAKKEKERIFYKQALQLEYENYFLKVKISQLESQLGIAPSQQNAEVVNTGSWN